MPENRLPRDVFLKIVQGTRLRGRQPNWWSDNIRERSGQKLNDAVTRIRSSNVEKIGILFIPNRHWLWDKKIHYCRVFVINSGRDQMETKTVSTVGRCQARGEPFYEGIQPPRPTHLHNTALPLPFAYNPDNICRGHQSASAFIPVPPLPSCPDPQIGKKHQGVQRTHVPAPRTDRVFWILKNVRRLSARQDEDSLISRGGGEGRGVQARQLSACTHGCWLKPYRGVQIHTVIVYRRRSN